NAFSDVWSGRHQFHANIARRRSRKRVPAVEHCDDRSLPGRRRRRRRRTRGRAGLDGCMGTSAWRDVSRADVVEGPCEPFLLGEARSELLLVARRIGTTAARILLGLEDQRLRARQRRTQRFCFGRGDCARLLRRARELGRPGEGPFAVLGDDRNQAVGAFRARPDVPELLTASGEIALEIYHLSARSCVCRLEIVQPREPPGLDVRQTPLRGGLRPAPLCLQATELLLEPCRTRTRLVRR